MGIAGQIVQRAEFPKNGDIRLGAERLFQFGEIGNLVSTQIAANNASGTQALDQNIMKCSGTTKPCC
jgi:hypothetical protein